MPSSGLNFAHILAVVVAAGLVSIPAAAWASEGGGGGGFELRYDPDYKDAAEDEDDDTPPDAFSVRYSFSLGSGLGFKFDKGLTYEVERIETIREPEVELYGPSLREDTFNYVTPRFSYRFPILYNPPKQTDSGAANADSGFEFRFQTWGSERAVERFNLEATYGQWEEEDKDKTETERVSVFYSITQLEAEKMRDSFEELARYLQVREFLGNEAFDKLQAEFGRRPSTADIQTSEFGASVSWSAANGIGSATDLSDWEGEYLYCGGTCVPSAE